MPSGSNFGGTQMDFVVGIKIQLSNNHNCRGVPAGMFFDICDELKGDYPKDFKFVGWHPHCRCYATPILKTEQELAADNERIMQGEEPTDQSENTVTIPPQEWFSWLMENYDRAPTSYSVPYFLRDNEKFIPKDYIKIYASRMPYDTYAEYEAAMKFNKKYAQLSPEQRANIRELNKVMPVVQGKVMNITEANEGKVNPLYETGKTGYRTNCATCVPTYLLRRRGFNITAGKNIGKGKVYELSQNGLKIWKRNDGTTIMWGDKEVVRYEDWAKIRPKDQSLSLKSFVENNADEPGIYMVRLGWKKGGGHFTTVEVTKDGNIIYYDPQSSKKNWLNLWESKASQEHCWMMRVDNKLIDPDFASCFVKAT